MKIDRTSYPNHYATISPILCTFHLYIVHSPSVQSITPVRVPTATYLYYHNAGWRAPCSSGSLPTLFVQITVLSCSLARSNALGRMSILVVPGHGKMELSARIWRGGCTNQWGDVKQGVEVNWGSTVHPPPHGAIASPIINVALVPQRISPFSVSKGETQFGPARRLKTKDMATMQLPRSLVMHPAAFRSACNFRAITGSRALVEAPKTF